MFYGLKECLEFAERKKLYKLYITSINRLNSDLFLRGADFSENINVKKIIYQIINNINKDILKKNIKKINIHNFLENYNIPNNFIKMKFSTKQKKIKY